EGVTVLDASGDPAFSVDRIHAALSLGSLAAGQIRFARLEVEAPSLRIERLAPDRFVVGGIELDLAGAGKGGGDTGGADWLFAQRLVALRGVDLQWIDRVSGRVLELEGADLVLGAVGRRHRLSLKVA